MHPNALFMNFQRCENSIKISLFCFILIYLSLRFFEKKTGLLTTLSKTGWLRLFFAKFQLEEIVYTTKWVSGPIKSKIYMEHDLGYFFRTENSHFRSLLGFFLLDNYFLIITSNVGCPK